MNLYRCGDDADVWTMNDLLHFEAEIQPLRKMEGKLRCAKTCNAMRTKSDETLNELKQLTDA